MWFACILKTLILCLGTPQDTSALPPEGHRTIILAGEARSFSIDTPAPPAVLILSLRTHGVAVTVRMSDRADQTVALAPATDRWDDVVLQGSPGSGGPWLVTLCPQSARIAPVEVTWGETPTQAPTPSVALARMADGEAAMHAGRFTDALTAFAAAADARRDEEQGLGRAEAFKGLAWAAQRLGAYDDAGAYYAEALIGAIACRDAALQAQIYGGLGGVYVLQGRPEAAIAHYRAAAAAAREAGEPLEEAKVKNNLGAFYRALGDWQAALAAYRDADTLLDRAPNLYWRARLYNNIGYLYLELDEWERAHSYLERALDLRRKVGDRAGEAVTLNNLGRVARERGDLDAAVAAHEAALALRGTDNPRGRAVGLTALGLDHQGRGDHAAARPLFAEALAIEERLGNAARRADLLVAVSRDPEAAWRRTALLEEADALYTRVQAPAGRLTALNLLAEAALAAGDEATARRRLTAAVAALEHLRLHAVGPSSRRALLAGRRDLVEHAVRLEAARALRTGTPSQIRTALTTAEQFRARTLRDLLAETAPVGRDADTTERRALQRELAAVVAARAQNAAPDLTHRYYALLGELELLQTPAALPAPDLPNLQTLVPDDTALLYYSLGEHGSYVWTFVHGRLSLRGLPRRDMLEPMVRGLVTAVSRWDATAGQEDRRAARTLGALLLGPPETFAGIRRLLVVPDGVLHYLPFQALAADEKTAPLSRETVVLPSLTVLTEIRRRMASNPPPTDRIKVYADPVFSRRDARAGVAAGVPTDDTQDFARLQATALEARAIADRAPGKVDLFQGFAATRDQVMQDASFSRIAHFATHGLIDPTHPERSCLVLSLLAPDGSRTDGYLRYHDVFAMQGGADLVVLSGCRTALGKAWFGEGLESLVLGFMSRGARTVVASLWQVPDRATASLMDAFYTHLLTHGRSASEALVAAQRDVRAERRTRDPYFWAGFILLGDWQ